LNRVGSTVANDFEYLLYMSKLLIFSKRCYKLCFLALHVFLLAVFRLQRIISMLLYLLLDNVLGEMSVVV